MTPVHGADGTAISSRASSSAVLNQRERVNGWSWPPHPLQFVAWFFLIFFSVFYFGVIVFYLPKHWQAAGIIVSLTFIVNFASRFDYMFIFFLRISYVTLLSNPFFFFLKKEFLGLHISVFSTVFAPPILIFMCYHKLINSRCLALILFLRVDSLLKFNNGRSSKTLSLLVE